VGASAFGMNDIYARLKAYKQHLVQAKLLGRRRLYMVALDVKNAFDSIPHDKLLEIATELLTEARTCRAAGGASWPVCANLAIRPHAWRPRANAGSVRDPKVCHCASRRAVLAAQVPPDGHPAWYGVVGRWLWWPFPSSNNAVCSRPLLDRQINSPTFTSSPSNWPRASGKRSLSTGSVRRDVYSEEQRDASDGASRRVGGRLYLQATIRIEERHAILPLLREHIMNNLVKVAATGTSTA